MFTLNIFLSVCLTKKKKGPAPGNFGAHGELPGALEH